MRTIKMNASGRVQGVGFRYMTKMVADQIGIGGLFVIRMTDPFI